jgi:hypothetical protein
MKPCYLETIFFNMVQRCRNSRHPDFRFYGGRGIKVCKRWTGSYGLHRFCLDILRYLGPKPTIGRWCIDRIDSDGDYKIRNLRWSTALESGRNKRPRRGKPDLMTNVELLSNVQSGMLNSSQTST